VIVTSLSTPSPAMTMAPVSVMTATITAKLACAATSAGMTPGRRSSSRSGVVRVGSSRGVS